GRGLSALNPQPLRCKRTRSIPYHQALPSWQIDRHLRLAHKKLIDGFFCTGAAQKPIVVEDHHSTMFHAWVEECTAAQNRCVNIDIDMNERECALLDWLCGRWENA